MILRQRRQSVLERSSQRRHRPDYALVILASLLLVVGLVVIYSISPALSAQTQTSENYFVSKQLIAILLGVAAFAIASVIPLEVWRRSQNGLITAALSAAVMVRLFGEKVNGAYRWIHIGGLSFQAVELIKIALLVWLASFLVQRWRNQELNSLDKTFKPLLIALGVLGVVVAKVQSDLGSMAVIMAMMLAMCFVIGLPMKRVAIFGGIVLIGGIMAISTSGYRRQRLFTYLHPQSDCLDAGYQSCQALIAVGSGGLAGKGLAHSVQAYGYLPEAANDSIFAIIAEKFGFVGVTTLICLLMVFFNRLKNIMERAPDMFSRLLVAGILAWLSTQAIVNIGAMIGLLPLKGITLPFISYGGTSIMFVMAATGLAFNISRYTTYNVNDESSSEGSSHDRTADWRRNRRPHYAANSRRT